MAFPPKLKCKKSLKNVSSFFIFLNSNRLFLRRVGCLENLSFESGLWVRISTDFNQGPQIKDFQLGSWVRIWCCEFLKFWYLNSTWVSQAPKFFPWDKILCLCMVAFNLLYANGWEVIAWLSSSSPPWPLLFPESFDRSLVLAWKICIINEGFSTKRLQACWVCFYYTTWEQGVYWTKKKMSILIFFTSMQKLLLILALV